MNASEFPQEMGALTYRQSVAQSMRDQNGTTLREKWPDRGKFSVVIGNGGTPGWPSARAALSKVARYPDYYLST